jgi:hypothetical protein
LDPLRRRPFDLEADLAVDAEACAAQNKKELLVFYFLTKEDDYKFAKKYSCEIQDYKNGKWMKIK